MQFTVYVLKSLEFEKTYVGLTSDLKRRLSEHNSGKSRSTKLYVPWKLVHTEMFEDRTSARKREKQFKSGSGREFLKKILATQV